MRKPGFPEYPGISRPEQNLRGIWYFLPRERSIFMKEITLEELEPKEVLREFYGLCGIPHGSGNIRKISDYLMKWAAEHGIRAVQEPCGNVIMYVPGTPGYEKHETVVLQGHMDMVAVKDPGIAKDMEKEGLDLLSDGNYLYANGTSLGGDDGIAIAYALAVFADPSIPHPPLELLATVNEETGMDGAMAFDASLISGRTLLNIDSEDEGIFLTGCAGGTTVKLMFPAERETEAAFTGLEVRLFGLAGGHSGTEIDKGRKNAVLELATLLRAAREQTPFRLAEINGGEKDNAIPAEARALLAVSQGTEEAVIESVQDVFDLFAGELHAAEPGMRLMLTKLPSERVPLTDADTNRALEFLSVLPFGVSKMSDELPGIVETSNNVGICRTEDSCLTVQLSVRSMKETEKIAFCGELSSLADRFGAEMTRNSDYPGWSYRPDSPLRDKMVKVYTEFTGQPPVLTAIHAGLECGLLLEKLPDLDCVSFGPDILDIHTTKERLDLASTGRVWEFLKRLLREM